MPTNPQFLAQINELRDKQLPGSDNELHVLQTPAAVVGYLVAVGREQDLDIETTINRIETILVDVDLPSSTLREAATVLRSLKYPTPLTSMLGRLARRAARAKARKPQRRQAHRQASNL